MIELMVMLAAGMAQPAAAEAQPEAARRERVVCRRLTARADSRLGGRRLCLTEAQWEARRDEYGDNYLVDMPQDSEFARRRARRQADD